MSITRRRLTSDQSRDAAIAAARELLIANGPSAVTLKAVGARIGQSHANLLHHFGSAAGLQGALATAIATDVTGAIADAVERARIGEVDARTIVDRTFDAFDEQGAGALAAWMLLTGNRDALDPILASIRTLVAQLGAGHDGNRVAQLTLTLVLSALGDSLLGEAIASALEQPRDTARLLAARQLEQAIEAARGKG